LRLRFELCQAVLMVQSHPTLYGGHNTHDFLAVDLVWATNAANSMCLVSNKRVSRNGLDNFLGAEGGVCQNSVPGQNSIIPPKARTNNSGVNGRVRLSPSPPRTQSSRPHSHIRMGPALPHSYTPGQFCQNPSNYFVAQFRSGDDAALDGERHACDERR
jgi:hypothetical protein